MRSGGQTVGEEQGVARGVRDSIVARGVVLGVRGKDNNANGLEEFGLAGDVVDRRFEDRKEVFV